MAAQFVMSFCGILRLTVVSTCVWVLDGVGAWAQTTVNFPSTSPVDLGTNLPKLADLDPWSYALGTSWDEAFTICGIIGAAFQTFGSYTQTALANLVVDLAGPHAGEDYDQLLAESAILAGSLTIQTDPSVVVTAYGQHLNVVLTDNGITGRFDSIVGLAIDDDHQWVVFYEPDRVSLAAGRSGDADLNGVVEFSDFLVLSANFGQSSHWSGGDFDGNGMVQFADFLILADDFGKQTAAAVVPEPKFSFGTLLGVLWFLRRKRRS